MNTNKQQSYIQFKNNIQLVHRIQNFLNKISPAGQILYDNIPISFKQGTNLKNSRNSILINNILTIYKNFKIL